MVSVKFIRFDYYLLNELIIQNDIVFLILHWRKRKMIESKCQDNGLAHEILKVVLEWIIYIRHVSKHTHTHKHTQVVLPQNAGFSRSSAILFFSFSTFHVNSYWNEIKTIKESVEGALTNAEKLFADCCCHRWYDAVFLCTFLYERCQTEIKTIRIRHDFHTKQKFNSKMDGNRYVKPISTSEDGIVLISRINAFPIDIFSTYVFTACYILIHEDISHVVICICV